MEPHLSIIIPARNEERYLPLCLDAITKALEVVPEVTVEVIVVLNRCTDQTEAIAREWGCVVVGNDSKNLSMIRNAGIAAARGEIVVTIDADSRMERSFLSLIVRTMKDPHVVGGGCLILPERWSLGILCTGILVMGLLWWYGVSVGAFFARREAVAAIGGFDESLASVEDIDFARRLRKHAVQSGGRFKNLWRARIITSCRKFDRFGEWHLLSNPKRSLRLLRGTSQDDANQYWYDIKR